MQQTHTKPPQVLNLRNAQIYEITPFTMLDFADHIAAIAWFCGCNMRCNYCYNPQIVTSRGKISNEEFLRFLDARAGKLQGIVFSGGECTCASDFIPLAHEVKRRGFLLKVDTNGSNPQKIEEALSLGLIDYIALDFKAPRQDFELITKSSLYDKFLQTLRLLLRRNFKFEVRTTVHADFLNEAKVEQMAQILYSEGYRGVYYLQSFLPTGDNFGNLDAPLASFDPSKIRTDLKIELRNFD